MGKGHEALREEMLAAFLAISPPDAHVEAWRARRRAEMAVDVDQSVIARRRMSGASGAPEAVSDARPDAAHKMLPDPYLTDAEYFARRRTQLGPNVGKALVRVNMIELIGGLARIVHTDTQEAAAARFRLVHERAQIGGARAIDYAMAKVDTSGPREEMVELVGAAARAEYSAAVRYLGMIKSSLVERVVVHDQSISSIAGRGMRDRRRVTADLLAALDDLAVHFRLAAKKAA